MRVYGRDYALFGVAWRPGSDPGRPTRDDYGAGAELERHLAGGLTNPLPPATEGHPPALIEHSHRHHHQTPGTADDDINHSHWHTHKGDSSHDHHSPADVLGDKSGALMPGAEPGDLVVWQVAAALDTDWRPADVRGAMLSSDEPDRFAAAVCGALGAGQPGDVSRWGLPHHDAPDLPPVAAACRLAWAALEGGYGLPPGTDADRARAHIAGHLREVNPLWPLESSGLTLAVVGLVQPGDWDA